MVEWSGGRGSSRGLHACSSRGSDCRMRVQVPESRSSCGGARICSGSRGIGLVFDGLQVSALVCGVELRRADCLWDVIEANSGAGQLASMPAEVFDSQARYEFTGL
ncbi:hypothetical protein AXG93_1054s1390 [Marchantia polymorpha subsp. ruderalis]|uniref:Uncharacterized protein n=1 Tax=Marchantia polymorpha subsp. ruderalis TaxID=1480154 RepID=A0A176WNC7_MARPO|nr:hypothetical protein AXG93_1054s1390 [Marchantia polymorpha subsp. ruderalis]